MKHAFQCSVVGLHRAGDSTQGVREVIRRLEVSLDGLLPKSYAVLYKNCQLTRMIWV